MCVLFPHLVQVSNDRLPAGKCSSDAQEVQVGGGGVMLYFNARSVHRYLGR